MVRGGFFRFEPGEGPRNGCRNRRETARQPAPVGAPARTPLATYGRGRALRRRRLHRPHLGEGRTLPRARVHDRRAGLLEGGDHPGAAREGAGEMTPESALSSVATGTR